MWAVARAAAEAAGSRRAGGGRPPSLNHIGPNLNRIGSNQVGIAYEPVQLRFKRPWTPEAGISTTASSSSLLLSSLELSDTHVYEP